MIIEGLQCPRCSDIIFSRTPEDLRKCSCENIYVKGFKPGTNPFEFGYKIKAPKVIQINILANEKELKADYEFKTNKWGLITPSEFEKMKKELEFKEKE